MSKPKSWLASIDSPVGPRQLVRMWETSPSVAQPRTWRVLRTARVTTTARVANPKAYERAEEVMQRDRKKALVRSPEPGRASPAEDLTDLVLGQLSARSIKSDRPLPPSKLPAQQLDALSLRLRSQIAAKARGLAPFSLFRLTPFHLTCDNPKVARFLTRFQHKSSAKTARIGRRGFQPQKVLHRPAQPTKSLPTAEDYVEYLSLQPSR